MQNKYQLVPNCVYIYNVVKKFCHVIILLDADSKPHEKQIKDIKSFLSDVDMNFVHIVLLDHEIKEWICYSEGIIFVHSILKWA